MTKNAALYPLLVLSPKIIRIAETKCCKWCQNLEGEYSYPNVPDDIYRRHERCRCTVSYDPGSRKKQNVYSKKWTDSTSNDILDTRKIIGLRINNVTVQSVSDHVFKRMRDRDVSIEDIAEAISNPLKIKSVKINPETGLSSLEIIGSRASFAINPDTGKIITTCHTGSKTIASLKKERSVSK